MLTHKNLPVISFKNKSEFDKWLSKNHNKPKYHTVPKGIWLRFYKVNSNTPTISKTDAIDSAICWGWIDGLINGYDEQSYLLKFTPRGSKSIWSKINVDRVTRLTKEGLIQPSGQIHIDKAKADGRWAAAYQPPSKMTMPKEFIELVKTNKKAWEFYQTLNKTNIYAIAVQITTAKKAVTKQRRIEKYFQMMKDGTKLY